MSATSIMIVGVGGQGTLLASRVLGNLLVKLEYDVKVSEIHGMAQRGGSVVTYVRFGDKVHSPIVDECGADYILAFEQLEGYRSLPYLKHDGVIIVNDQQLLPMPVITGQSKYPENIIEKLKEAAPKTVAIPALSVATNCGNAKTVNTVLLGRLAKELDIEKGLWIETIKDTVPEKLLDINLKAFEAGMAFA